MADYEINITKSWRKSLSMRFDSKWVLQVKAPKLLLRTQIDAFIKKNTPWIEKEYAKISQRNIDKQWYLFGKVQRGLLWELCQDKLLKFYKAQAKKYLIPRCNELAEKYWFTHKWIRITSASTRWGSCSSKKTLNFSYRLIMAPKEAIDYVIIHELCHLRQMNHGAKFWKEVSDIMPEYKEHENHLKSDGWKYRV